MKKERQRGFTFFEILLVVAISTAITATGIVGLSRLQAIFKLKGAADTIRGQLQLGRELAIANKDQVNYQIKLNSGIVILTGGNNEIARYQTPLGISYTPSTFTYGFTVLTGTLSGCALPCHIVLTSGADSETITVFENGITN